jgi:phosphatidylglycerol:prolipoprotein diacylglycerol transferase
LRDPWKLLRIWEGIGSFGGFIGGTIGILLWKRKYDNAPIMPIVENIATIFPISWIFGRAGCSIAHDHPGPLSHSFLAVHFPPAPLVNAARQQMEMSYMQSPAERMSHYAWGIFDWGYYYLGFADSVCAGKPVYTVSTASHCAPADWPARFDLGLLEWFCTIPMAAFIYWYASKPRKLGQILGVLSMLYAPVRFAIDTLRATDISNADARYAGLTPAQWLAIVLFGFGLQLYLRATPRELLAAEGPSAEPPDNPEAPSNNDKPADAKPSTETPAGDKPVT